jgi:copine 5/8/9
MQPAFQPGSASAGSSTVELSVSCRKLVDMDVFSKSDPMCVLFVKEPGRNEWREFGRTEIVDNSLNPDFVKKFVISYFFEERQHLRFEVFDVDSKSANLRDHDFLGRAEFTLGEVVSSGKTDRPLLGGPSKMSGCIVGRSNRSSRLGSVVRLRFPLAPSWARAWRNERLSMSFLRARARC